MKQSFVGRESAVKGGLGMKELAAVILLSFGLCLTANADIWKWVDADGNVHYSDTPARANASGAERVDYTLRNRSASKSSDSRAVTSQADDVDSDETAEEGQAREDAQTYYCEKAKDIYRSYVDAPRLYRTGADGQREYLSSEEAAATLADARAKVAEWCN